METQCLMLVRDDDNPYDKKPIHLINKQIDLSPLKDVIENGGLKILINELREIHHTYSCLIMENVMNDKTGYLSEDMLSHLFYLKTLAEAFEKVREFAISVDQQ